MLFAKAQGKMQLNAPDILLEGMPKHIALKNIDEDENALLFLKFIK